MTHDSEICYDTDDKHIIEIERLNKEIERMSAVILEGSDNMIKRLNVKIEELKEGNIDTIFKLNAEIERKDALFSDYGKRAREHHERGEEYERELKAELEKANSNNMRYSSLKEYKKEAEEYFNNNPQSKGIRFHMIDFNDYDYDDNDGLNGMSGEYNGLLLAEDSLIEIDNPHLK